jgi:hypothetical protein
VARCHSDGPRRARDGHQRDLISDRPRPGCARPTAELTGEHRFARLDRRTFPFAVVALAVWVLWAYVVPAIDEHSRTEIARLRG